MVNHKPNRLITETSPYLLQHAYHPVHWYPWSEEAFEKARKENKPIFLSIGYSTCHWCHVFAHESFEDEEVAGLLNTYFIAIKVDREERPDIDSVYMTVCQALTGQGGWPLSIFMTPEQQPFYAGTYFPKESRYGQPGFIDVLQSIAKQYHDRPKKLQSVGQDMITELSAMHSPASAFTPKLLEQALSDFKSSFDEGFGGFGSEPKFPAPHQLLFLMRAFYWNGDTELLIMVEKTLDAIAAGGIHDHIGGGFARYAVDSIWLVPHFEKMLYDQAMLMLSFTEAYQLTGHDRYRQVVEGIFTYLMRDLRDKTGAFYSAEDADSEGVEGRFYVWDPNEVIALLGDAAGERFCVAYGITEEGNFEGKNIPNLIGRNLQHLAEDYGLSLEAFERELEASRQILLKARSQRVRPHRDEKILTSWNGLTIAALATAGQVMKDARYLKAATDAFEFIMKTMWDSGQLLASYREGQVTQTGFLDDYAYMLWAADTLYEATFKPQYIDTMKELSDQMIQHFWDDTGFGFYLNDKNQKLIMRPKDIYDGALPSGNSIATMMLFKLARRTGDVDYEMYVDKVYGRFAGEIAHYPMGYSALLTGYLLIQMKIKELVVLDENAEGAAQATRELLKAFHPDVIALSGTPQSLNAIASFTKGFALLNHQTTYFLCENFSCTLPTNQPKEVARKIKRDRGA
ncbi:hypothetical protein GCM10011391_31650 [Pullulanibacillus camelliae]|uniref:Spermatogenesis-associated protein 20-like TRX domain-containing protein n=1 Tax=Pullulanibacillus camelliae TaxID=1707096 RepID=A0A8J3DYP9_9BACL|nr:thioredoxin domain-containing protein [Pullulanibacillus camelliae]GGE50543.1 hypothetical protein GCM10011391_31650 [Pullulanibacillus camelliae]